MAQAMGRCNPKGFSQMIEAISEIANCLFRPVPKSRPKRTKNN
jgi:hypothetical protein